MWWFAVVVLVSLAGDGLIGRLAGLPVGFLNRQILDVLVDLRPAAAVACVPALVMAVATTARWWRLERSRPQNRAKHVYLLGAATGFAIAPFDPVAGLLALMSAHSIEYVIVVAGTVRRRAVPRSRSIASSAAGADRCCSWPATCSPSSLPSRCSGRPSHPRLPRRVPGRRRAALPLRRDDLAAAPARGSRARSPSPHLRMDRSDGPGATVAAAFRAAVRRDGLTPDPSLRLLAWADPAVEVDADLIPSGPHDLGVVQERLVDGAERLARGAWYTPPRPRRRSGGPGVHHRRGPRHDRGRSGVRGRGIPPRGGGSHDGDGGAGRDRGPPPRRRRGSAGGRGRRGGAVVVVGPARRSSRGRRTAPGRRRPRPRPRGTVDVVVGNPPFLGQLRSATASSADATRRALAAAIRSDSSVPTPTSLAVPARCGRGRASRRCGRARAAVVAPRQPATPGRSGPRSTSAGRLGRCWIDDGPTFDAAVQACAPVLRVGRVGHERLDGAARRCARRPRRATSTARHRRRRGLGRRRVPRRVLRPGRRRRTRAATGRRLVTSGAIDPLRRRDGVGPRFAKQRGPIPRRLVGLTSDRGHAMGRRSRPGPKLLVATQTRVIEAVVDEDGSLVASVPTIVVTPARRRPTSGRSPPPCTRPCVSAWMLQPVGRHRAVERRLQTDGGPARRPAVALSTAAAWDRGHRAGRGASPRRRRWLGGVRRGGRPGLRRRRIPACGTGGSQRLPLR